MNYDPHSAIKSPWRQQEIFTIFLGSPFSQPPPSVTMATSSGEGGVQIGMEEGARASSPSHLYATLRALGIPIRVSPYFHSGDDQRKDQQGLFCKNLFLKDRKGTFYLVITHEDKNVNLKALKASVSACRNFSFATKDDLLTMLGVFPGGVTPLALKSSLNQNIRLIVDEELASCETDLNFHPLDPDKTLLISFENLKKFTFERGYKMEVVKILS